MAAPAVKYIFEFFIPTKTLAQHLSSKNGAKKILSPEEGAIRSALTVGFFFGIERIICQKSKDPEDRLYDYFDLISNTKTFTIIDFALALGVPIKDIQKNYLFFFPLDGLLSSSFSNPRQSDSPSSLE